MEVNDKFCRNCGRQLVNVPMPRSKKDHVTAGILAICLGGIGAHRFYLGEWIGLIYLLFCWTGIPMMVGVVEGVTWLTNPKTFYEKYGGR